MFSITAGRLKLYGNGARIIKKVLAKLYGIHIGAFLAVWLGMFFPGVDVALAIIYVLITGYVIRAGALAGAEKWKALFWWQGPGLMMSLVSSLGIIWLDISNYSYFVLEFWYTPLIPLLSLLPVALPDGYPLYYYLLLFMPLIMSAHFALLSQEKGIAAYKA